VIDRTNKRVMSLWIIQLFKYSWVGMGSTLIHVAIASAVIFFCELSATGANTAAFLVAMTFSYTANAKWSFQQDVNLTNGQRFIAVSLISYIIILLVSKTFEHWHLPPLYSVAVVAFIIPLIVFVAHKFWTFNT